jgi:hypothetical protein
MSEQTVKLAVRQDAADPYEHALESLREALGDARVDGPDDAGVIEVTLDAGDEDAAIQRVIDGIAAAGADDHFEIAEHP